MEQSDQIDVLLQLFDQVSLGNLLVIEVVQKSHVRIVNFFHDLESFRHRGEIVLGIFFRIDILQQKCDVPLCGEVSRSFKSFDAAIMLVLP